MAGKRKKGDELFMLGMILFFKYIYMHVVNLERRDGDN